jgi:hypothetical protein
VRSKHHFFTGKQTTFEKIFYNEMDDNQIKEFYEWYTKKLHECRRTGGQITRYRIVDNSLIFFPAHVPHSAA